MSKSLAERAVVCKHWRWMPGMRAVDGAERFRVSVVSHGYPQGVDEQPPMKVNVDLGLRWFPDLTDPATLGCLLSLVREAWSDPSLCANDAGHYDLMFWHVYTGDRNVSVGCQTEAEALVAALEAAP